MNNRLIVLATLVVLLLLLLCRWGGSNDITAISFVVNLTDSTATVVRYSDVAVLRHRPKPRAMRLTDAAWRSAPNGTSELITAFLDETGNVIDPASWGFPGRSHNHVEQTERDVLTGRRVRARQDQRLFHLPVPGNASFVGLYRHSVVDEDPQTSGLPHDVRLAPTPPDTLYLAKTLLKVIPLRPGTPAPAVLDFPGESVAASTPMSVSRWSRAVYFASAASTDPLYEAPGVVPYKECGDNSDCYNIVVVGDGFQTDEELDGFESYAGTVIDALLDAAPMSDYADDVNVYFVRAKSNDSGISCCGDATERDTYFDVRSQWRELDSETGDVTQDCVNSPISYALGQSFADQQDVYDAAAGSCSYWEAHLYIVIANCNGGQVGAGTADRDSWIAYVGLSTDAQRFENVAVHECAHVMAYLADEYLGCTAPETDESFWFLEPNVAYIERAWLEEPDNLIAAIENVAWRGPGGLSTVALESNLHSDLAGSHNAMWSDLGYPLTEAELIAEFPQPGLYWGAQYFNLDEASSDPYACPSDFEIWSDDRGADFYRSQVTCKMRNAATTFFCFACTKALRQALE